MFDRLPDRVDPARLSAQAREIKGFLALEDMPRLSEALLDTVGRADAGLAFVRRPDGMDGVRGRVEAVLKVQCQRCLGPLELRIGHEFEARLVPGDEALARVPDHEDAILLDAGMLSLHGLVEDELILALPVVALHGPETPCGAGVRTEFGEPDVKRARQVGEDNPFGILKSLKGSLDKK